MRITQTNTASTSLEETVDRVSSTGTLDSRGCVKIINVVPRNRRVGGVALIELIQMSEENDTGDVSIDGSFENVEGLLAVCIDEWQDHHACCQVSKLEN